MNTNKSTRLERIQSQFGVKNGNYQTMQINSVEYKANSQS